MCCSRSTSARRKRATRFAVVGCRSSADVPPESARRDRTLRYASSRMERLVWTPDEVVDVDGPRAMLRAYLEQRDVRELCARATGGARFGSACDVGCGFGRLTPVLTEFADRVVGFEREPGLLTIARSLQPSIEFRAIEALTRLPADDSSFDFALVFTVLQHVAEPDVHDVLDELRRIVAPVGASVVVRGNRSSARGRRSGKGLSWLHLRTAGHDL